MKPPSKHARQQVSISQLFCNQVTILDKAIGDIFEACKQHNYIMMVTADHGNAEQMIAEDGGKFTAHTCFPVPFTCSSDKYKLKTSLPDRPPALRDVAPTVLDLLGYEIPKEMDGVSLIA
jgi:2,3-bisphosphoglycerate-independent phosphoglycerate mutase